MLKVWVAQNSERYVYLVKPTNWMQKLADRFCIFPIGIPIESSKGPADEQNQKNKNCSELLMTNGMIIDRVPFCLFSLVFLKTDNAIAWVNLRSSISSISILYEDLGMQLIIENVR